MKPTTDRADRSGTLFVVSAPSGAGKTTLCQAVRQQVPGLIYSVSSTTRPPREGERHGVDYFFVTEAYFRQGIEQGVWLEWAKVHGHYYGTSARFIARHLERGHHVLLDVDVQGAKQIVAHHPDAVTLFIMAPSLAVLRERLTKRGQDDAAVIERRLQNARKEIACKRRYRHVIVNDDFETAVARFVSILRAETG